MNFLNRWTRISSLGTMFRINHCICVQKHQYTTTSVCIRQNFEKVQLYPTHYVSVREFGSSCITRNSKNNDAKSDDKGDLPKDTRITFDISIICSWKFLFYTFKDRGLKYHFGESFIEGARLAFMNISKNLLAKDYEYLDGVLNHELLQRVKQEEISCPEPAKLLGLTLVDMYWRYNESEKEKHIAVDVALIYSPAVAVGELLEKNMFAVLRFHRIFSEDVKNPRWIVSDICYVNSISRFRILFQLNKLKMKHW